MTKSKAIKLAKRRIRDNIEYIIHIEQYDKEHPYPYPDQLGPKITKLVVGLVEEEIALIMHIIFLLSEKPRKMTLKGRKNHYNVKLLRRYGVSIF